MCLWVLTACLGLFPVNPSPTVIYVQGGAPPPIIVPTAAPTRPPTAPPTPPPTAPPTAPTTRPGPPPTTIPSPPPTTAPPPTNPTPPPTPPPTTPPPPPPPPPTTAAPPVTSVATLGGVLLQVVLCNNPNIVCIANPDDKTNTGPPPIDPRLGTTPAASAALQVPPITGYNALGISPSDSAVKFPRQRRSAKDISEISIKDYVMNEHSTYKHEIRKRQSCACVPIGTCPTAAPPSPGGAGLIDLRIVTPGACPAGQVYCCGAPVPQTVSCGILQAVPPTAVAPGAGQASFGEYPWQALILTKQNDYVAGGVLIDNLNILTVTHRMLPYIVTGTAPNIKVRLGEWDAAGIYEPIPYQEYNVLKVFTHPSYNNATLQYDITVLRLATPVPFTPTVGAATTINRACLPPAATSVYTGQRCWVSGWGKNMFGLQGQYQQILKEVDVPIVAPASCQTQLQTARLGASYVLDTTSFICAGGEANKDSCTGDGGSGLVCPVNGQWVLVGLVSWGLGCAMANVPGVYVNVPALLPWIQQQVATP